MAEAYDPTSGQRVSALGVFFKLFFVTLFVGAGGHRLVVSAFGGGLERLPPASVGPAGLRGLFGPDTAAEVATLVGELLLVAIQLTLPVICVMIVIDISLGLLNRVAPQISAFFLGMTIKGTMGVLVTLLVLSIGAEHFFELVPNVIRRILAVR
jgi:type III secretory pathway component EscT